MSYDKNRVNSNTNTSTSPNNSSEEKLALLSMFLQHATGIGSPFLPQSNQAASESIARHPETAAMAIASEDQRNNEEQPRDPTTDSQIIFPATITRASYTLTDISEAFLQGSGQGFYNKDPDFVDFVFCGCIEDELELSRRENSHMLLRNSSCDMSGPDGMSQ